MPERKVYKFRIDPTAEQEAALSCYAGARRFVFNWALARRKETYAQTGKSICWSGLSAELIELKNKRGFEWLKEIDSQLLQQALADCKSAFDNFFKKRQAFLSSRRSTVRINRSASLSGSGLKAGASTSRKSAGSLSGSL